MTSPFGIVLETALKHELQGGKLEAALGGLVKPAFFCCISGNTVGVAKDPVAHMGLSARRVCTMVPITVTYSGSWSPSSTINSWQVDWGDGNVSTGAWPGAGNVAHPAGGYAIPAHYHVVLTVTDLLGAVGTAEATVEVIDCTPPPPVLLMGGCGSSGPWYTGDAGVNWAESAGGVLDGVLIYDIKAVWSTLGNDLVELWAATENGLYRGHRNVITGVSDWGRITLPPPGGGSGEPLTIALCPSRFDKNEFFVLATIDGRTWLYRTGDSGVSWNSTTAGGYDPLELGTIGWEDIGGANDAVFDMETDGNYLYACGAFTVIGGVAANHIARYDGTSWSALGAGFGHSVSNLNIDEYDVLRVASSSSGAFLTAFKWEAGAWSALFPESPVPMDNPGYYIATSPISGEIAVASLPDLWVPMPPHLATYSGGVWTAYDTPSINGSVFALEYDENDTLWISGFWVTNPAAMRMVNSAIPGGQPDNSVSKIKADHNSLDLYVAGPFNNIGGVNAESIARLHNGNWEIIIAGGFGTASALYVHDSKLFLVGFSVGTIYKYDGVGRLPLGSASSTPYALCIYNRHIYAGGTFHSIDGVVVNHIARAKTVPPILPTNRRAHMMDMSADGQYVYVAMLTAANHPFLVRVRWDLQDFDVVYEYNTGTWAGVTCDPYNGNIAWSFGDFGTRKVVFTQDWGITWLNSTDATWGAGELVCPLLLSYWDTGDAVAVLNSTLRMWQTKDYGETWGNNGAINFICGCGARDFWEPLNIWLGRAAVGANHLQYSPNAGVNWIEHSGGFPAAAPVTALQVIG